MKTFLAQHGFFCCWILPAVCEYVPCLEFSLLGPESFVVDSLYLRKVQVDPGGAVKVIGYLPLVESDLFALTEALEKAFGVNITIFPYVN